MLRTLVLSALLAVGVCAPTDRALHARDFAERPADTFEFLPRGMHRCDATTLAVGWAKSEYVEHLCARFDEHSRPERHGPFVRYDRLGRRTLEGSFEAGLRHGVWQVYRDDGSLLYELVYERGRFRRPGCPKGELLTGHRNGWGAWCGPYTRALREGPAYSFHPETMRLRALGTYVQNRRHGTWVSWNDQGEMVQVDQYVSGLLAWRWQQRCPHVSAYPLQP